MHVLDTDRLTLRWLTVDDAPFILELLNEPSFLEFIGDRGVRTVADARTYLTNGPMASYAQHGFGLYLVALKDGAAPIGICGVLQREALADADVGFAFSPQYWLRGYAVEAAAAVLAYARETLGIPRVVAITSPDNAASIRVLEKLGLRFDRMVRLSEAGPESRLFVPAA